MLLLGPVTRKAGSVIYGLARYYTGSERYSAKKATAFAIKGPAGWWRIAKGLARYGLGVGYEHPAAPQFWQQALRDAAFTDVRFESIVAEAGIVTGIRPR